MIYHDSTKKIWFLKHQNKVKFKNLDAFEVLSSDFPVLKTSAASLASTAPLQPYFIKELPVHDAWIIRGTKMTNIGPFLWNGSSKIHFFADI